MRYRYDLQLWTFVFGNFNFPTSNVCLWQWNWKRNFSRNSLWEGLSNSWNFFNGHWYRSPMFWPCQNKHIKEVNRTEGTVTKAYVNSSRASRLWAWWKKDYGSCRLHLWRAVWNGAEGYWAPMARSGIYQVASLKWRPSSTFIWECDKKRIGFAAGLGNPPNRCQNQRTEADNNVIQ